MKTEFHAKHLSTTRDWGEVVQFLRYIPTVPMWVAPQMALKSTSGNNQHGEESEDEEDPLQPNMSSKALSRYRKAIMDQGFTYFRDEDKLWWIEFFEKQEDIVRHHLEPAQWRYEWTWPAKLSEASCIVEEMQPQVPEHLLQKVSGKQSTMYSGRRKTSPSFGDYRDLKTNTKFAMICVKAQGDPRKKPFWLAKVAEVMTHVDEVPEKIRIIWYTMDSDEPALEGKYFPERSKSSKKIMEDELSLSETTVYAYNFALLGNKAIPAVTKRIIQTALDEAEETEE